MIVRKTVKFNELLSFYNLVLQKSFTQNQSK